MLLLLQLSLLCCSVAITILNEKSFKTPSFTLFEHSDKFGTYYRKSLLAFYIMSSVLSIAGFYVPFLVKGRNRILYAYVFLSVLHTIFLIVNGSLHYTLHRNTLNVLNVNSIYYDGNDVIDIIQRTHRCCGPDGPIYWSKNTAWANRELAQYKYKVPKSCCNRKRCTLASMKFKELTIHKDSCQQHFVYSFESFLSYNWKFPFAICIIQSLIIVLCVIIVKLQKIGFLSKDVDEDGEERPMLFSKDLLRLSGQREKDKIHASQFWISKEEDANKDDKTTKQQQRPYGKNRNKKQKLGLPEDNNEISKTPLYRDINEKSYVEGDHERYEYVDPSRHSSFSRKSSYTDDYSSQRPSKKFHSPQILESPPTSRRKISRSRHSSRIRSQPSKSYYYDEDDFFRRERRNSSDEDGKFRRRRRRNRSRRYLDDDDDLDRRSDSNRGRRSKILSTLDELFRPKIVVDQRRRKVDSDEEMVKTLDKIDDLELDLRWQKLEALRRKKKRGLKKLEMLAREEDIENKKLEKLMR